MRAWILGFSLTFCLQHTSTHLLAEDSFFAQSIVYESLNIEHASPEDYLTLTDAYASRGEDYLILSSDKIVQETQGSLNGFRSFIFFPLLKLEKKNTKKTLEWIDHELKKAGMVIKKPVITSEGADLEAFSYPTLQYTVEQLVDQNNTLLPVLQAVLSINSVAELGKEKIASVVTTNRWSMYIDKTNDLQTVIKATLPILLTQFTTEFERAHSKGQKPNFYISYDDLWWDALASNSIPSNS